MITIKEVHSKSDLKAFVKFPFKLYKDNPYWVPPIISQEMNSFNKKENPVFLYENRVLQKINHSVSLIAAITLINYM